ncbi:MAG TPA: histidine kinase dimerization/phospho-acceptor domain-containing protein, partial [Cellvibrionaceae bacterium]
MGQEDESRALKTRIAELELELQRASIGRDSRLQYALEASRDGLWDWDVASNKVYFSRSYLRLLGYNFDHLPGTFETLCDYFLHPDDRDMVAMELSTAIDNCRQRVELEHRMLHRDGYTLWVQTHGLLVEPDENGKARRCVGTLTDISRTVHDQQSLIAAKAEAEMASNAKSKFLASMSHEIRTPMNAIIGLGHLLGDTDLDEVQKSYLTSMSVAANSLLQVLNQVFDYAKLEAGNIILENSHFDLEQLFERLSRIFETNALHRPVNIIFDISDKVPRFLRGDATRLSHIISHLVTNALQYSASDAVLVKAECVR